VITELNTATQDTGTAATASLSMAMYAKTILGNNEVPRDGRLNALITPAFEAYLMQTEEFSSADYVNNKPFTADMTMFRWAGVNWVVHPNLPGKGTNAEKCFMFHETAIGHAVNKTDIESKVGYDEEQAYSWARASIDMGAKLLQSTGVVVMNHDGSAFAAQ
jgi:hypothetical protein